MILRTTRWLLMLALLGAVVWKITAQTPPQVKISKGFSVPYSDPKDPRKKILFSGEEAIPLTGDRGLIQVRQFRMTKFVDGDSSKPELIIEAPECFFEPRSYTVSSTGPIRAYTADTNYLMEGVGFRWQQSRTNITMVLSNNVHTILQRTNAGVLRPPPTHIYSDRFRFDSVNDETQETRLARYSERVRVVDELAELSSDILTADIPLIGTNVSVLVAESNVVVVIRSDRSKATGDRAIYDARQGREILELTGHPVWTDGLRSIRADRFSMDRLRNDVLAEGQVRIRLPLESGGPGIFGLSGQAQKPASKSTNSLIEIAADQARVILSTNKQSGRVLLAERNVVILSLDDQSRATADKAAYSETTGRLDLTGNPRWVQGSNIVSGDVLSVVQSNRSLSAIGQAFVRVQADAMGSLAMSSGKASAGARKGRVAPHQVIDIHADRFDYQTNAAVFSGHVWGGLVVGGQTNFNFIAQNLALQIANSQVTRITARKLTVDENPATSATTNLLKRQVTVGILSIRRSPLTGLLETLTAEEGVFGEQIERGQGTNGPVQQSGQANLVVAQFNPKTNKVDGVIAEKNVILRKDAMALHGDRSVYVSGISNRLVEMSGNVWGAQAGIQFTNAPVLLWDLKSSKISAPQGWNILGTASDLKSNLIPTIRPIKTPP